MTNGAPISINRLTKATTVLLCITLLLTACAAHPNYPLAEEDIEKVCEEAGLSFEISAIKNTSLSVPSEYRRKEIFSRDDAAAKARQEVRP